MRSFAAATLASIAFAAGADYDNTMNGATWDGMCATGIEQSPINLVDAEYKSGMSIEMWNYG